MNWGNRLLITFIVFGAGISYMVYRSMHVNSELVETDYYKNELIYQQVIDATNRANALLSTVKLMQAKEGNILLQLPEEMKNKNISGDIWFYCAYDEAKDKKLPLAINADGMQSFRAGILTTGFYTARISWSEGVQKYYTEKPITVL
jgi:FixH